MSYSLSVEKLFSKTYSIGEALRRKINHLLAESPHLLQGTISSGVTSDSQRLEGLIISILQHHLLGFSDFCIYL